MSFFVAGGFPMVFLVVFGAVALLGALRFAVAPTPGRPHAVLAYAAAVAFVSLAGFAADLIAVTRVAGDPGFSADGTLVRILIVGFGEALSPVVLGSAVLAVVSLLLAIGLRRRGP